jgi:D-alanyl-D-alanine carboxypeptidase
MAVLLAEGVGGSIDDFAQLMTDTAHRLGMKESNFVNPNGLPADGQIVSARDLAILARALIHDFPEYSSYWHIPAIKFGRRVVRNYNPLLGRYPGADGMKTGFICASGFNLVATATRGDKHLIAVVLGAPSGGARAVKAAEMLETGFAQNPLSWLTPSLGTVDTLATIDASPPNLKDEMCGGHRSRMAAEEDDPDAAGDEGAASDSAGGAPKFSVMLSALRAPTAKNANLLSDDAPIVPVVVYTGPTRTPAQLDTLAAEPEAPDAVVKKKAAKHKPATAKAKGGASSDAQPAVGAALDGKSADGKSADGKSADGKSGFPPWTPMSSSALAASPPPDLKPDPPVATTAQAKPKPAAAANFQQ